MFSTKLQTRFALIPRWQRACLSCALLIALAPASLDARAEVFGGEELKDPTRPAGAPLAAEGGEGFLSGLFGNATGLLNSNYKVTFIRAGGSEPVAMINERLVKTGDMIGQAEVISIDAQSVSLRVNGAVQRVASYNDTVKTLAEPQ